MKYKSNLECPDLSSHFKLKDPPVQILGHDIPSDPDYEPNCGFWSNDEAAILFNVAKQSPMQSLWCDIGCRFGWTSKYINYATNGPVTCVDPGLMAVSRRARFRENTGFPTLWMSPHDSDKHFEIEARDVRYAGVVIDGNHDSPCPLNDAMNAAKFAAAGCVILLHDFHGKPIRDAANWLLDQGWNCRVYWTPNGVAVLWRGLPDFVPPDHVRDPALESAWDNIRRDCEKDFDFGRAI